MCTRRKPSHNNDGLDNWPLVSHLQLSFENQWAQTKFTNLLCPRIEVDSKFQQRFPSVYTVNKFLDSRFEEADPLLNFLWIAISTAGQMARRLKEFSSVGVSILKGKTVTSALDNVLANLYFENSHKDSWDKRGLSRMNVILRITQIFHQLPLHNPILSFV